jgi:glycosyltransferase involved in cell wall biosynthesis
MKKIPHKKFTIITVGRLVEEKDPTNIIHAIKDLDVDLKIIGSGYLYDKLINLIKNLSIENKVEIIKSVPYTEIHKHYLSADLFAISMYYGGVSIPMLEAMAASLPVVVSKSPLEKSKEIIEEVGFLVDNTPDSFRKVFIKLIEDPQLYRMMSEKSRAKAAELDGSIMEEKEANVYKEVLK